jgi:hypothetical protein
MAFFPGCIEFALGFQAESLALMLEAAENGSSAQVGTCFAPATKPPNRYQRRPGI